MEFERLILLQTKLYVVKNIIYAIFQFFFLLIFNTILYPEVYVYINDVSYGIILK